MTLSYSRQSYVLGSQAPPIGRFDDDETVIIIIILIMFVGRIILKYLIWFILKLV